jgi:hypothetical protein
VKGRKERGRREGWPKCRDDFESRDIELKVLEQQGDDSGRTVCWPTKARNAALPERALFPPRFSTSSTALSLTREAEARRVDARRTVRESCVNSRYGGGVRGEQQTNKRKEKRLLAAAAAVEVLFSPLSIRASVHRQCRGYHRALNRPRKGKDALQSARNGVRKPQHRDWLLFGSCRAIVGRAVCG